MNIKKIKILNIVRIEDIYQIDLKYINENNMVININIVVGNSKKLSSRKHVYHSDDNKKIEYEFVNKHNKIKDMHNDYINYLTNKSNKIATLEESFDIFQFINKIYSNSKLENKL